MECLENACLTAALNMVFASQNDTYVEKLADRVLT
jgi:hypothetical protein